MYAYNDDLIRPWLRRLQMPIRQKIAVGAILAMGGLYVPRPSHHAIATN